ncbi:hypothetical protein R1flu_017811 [Riccia fluitans]|uniref:Uncharacterized protein n=1 Tax=Riccia fluitans TaxID=41844 RepID=A0ABD1ZEA0_9MARC
MSGYPQSLCGGEHNSSIAQSRINWVAVIALCRDPYTRTLLAVNPSEFEKLTSSQPQSNFGRSVRDWNRSSARNCSPVSHFGDFQSSVSDGKFKRRKRPKSWLELAGTLSRQRSWNLDSVWNFTHAGSEQPKTDNGSGLDAFPEDMSTREDLLDRIAVGLPSEYAQVAGFDVSTFLAATPEPTGAPCPLDAFQPGFWMLCLRCIGELTFRSEVRAVRLRRDMVIVVLEHKIYTYNFGDLKLLYAVETLANPKGLCAVSYASTPIVMVCPGLRRGEVRVELYSQKKTKFIQAHDSSLACFGLTLDGSLLATASTKGTLIRIFNTNDGTKLQELRRGADRADIYSINFSPSTHWIVCSSDKGTVHVFSLASLGGQDARFAEAKNLNVNSGSLLMAGSALLSYAASNAGSSLSFMKGVLPKYFSSEWSFAQFRVPEDTHAIAAFGPEKNSVVIVCANGSFYRCSFDPVAGGEMVQQQYERYIKADGVEKTPSSTAT